MEEQVAELEEGQILIKVLYLSFDPTQRGWLNDVKSYVPPVQIGEVMRAGSVGQVIETRDSNFSNGDIVQGTFGWQEYAVVNGSSGIAVGMATNVPPHNLTEVLNGCLLLLDNPKASIDEIIQIITGPDFPTGGTIDGKIGIYEGYKTGRGIIHVRAKTSVEEDKSGKSSLIINEIPYMVNKAKMLERIAEMVKDKKIDGISEIRDESDKDGLRVVIEVKRGESVEVLENNLFAQSQLEQSFGINFTVLVDGQPRVLNIKEILQEFIKHRKDVVTKRTKFDLRKARRKIIFFRKDFTSWTAMSRTPGRPVAKFGQVWIRSFCQIFDAMGPDSYML